MKYDYDKNSPILYKDEEEEREAVELGIKQTLTSSNAYPKIGESITSTWSFDKSGYIRLVSKAVAWPLIKKDLLKPKNKFAFLRRILCL